MTTSGQLFSLSLDDGFLAVTDGGFTLTALSLNGQYLVAYDRGSDTLHHWKTEGGIRYKHYRKHCHITMAQKADTYEIYIF